MAKKKSFPLRVSEDILSAVQQWAADDLRSTNAQLEYIIRDALYKSGRLKKAEPKVTIEKDQ